MVFSLPFSRRSTTNMKEKSQRKVKSWPCLIQITDSMSHPGSLCLHFTPSRRPRNQLEINFTSSASGRIQNLLIYRTCSNNLRRIGRRRIRCDKSIAIHQQPQTWKTTILEHEAVKFLDAKSLAANIVYDFISFYLVIMSDDFSECFADVSAGERGLACLFLLSWARASLSSSLWSNQCQNLPLGEGDGAALQASCSTRILSGV